jgi:hypothetical protein
LNGQIEYLLKEAVSRRRKAAKDRPAAPEGDEPWARK